MSNKPESPHTSQPESRYSPWTREFMQEVEVTMREMNDLFEGLRQLGKALPERPITFDDIENHAGFFGSAAELVKAAVQRERDVFYGGGRQAEDRSPSYAETVVSFLYQGKRPNVEILQQMFAVWDQEEQTDLHYVIYKAFDNKYNNKPGFFMDLSGVDSKEFDEPVQAALEGKKVFVKDLNAQLVNGPDRDWYRIEAVEFLIEEAPAT